MKKEIFLSIVLFFYSFILSAQQQLADLVITDVTVVHVTDGRVIPHQAIIIKKDRIIATGPVSLAQKFKAKQVIQAKGKYIMPGLWDMHVHFGGDTLVDENKQLLPLYLSMGVTTVRDASGDISQHVFQWKEQISQGKLEGPRIFTSGPKLEGKQSIWPGDLEIATKEELTLALDSLQRAKVDFVKITDNTLQPSLFLESIKAARKRGWKVSGHSPVTFTLEELSLAGLSSIEHLGYILRAASTEEAAIAKMRADNKLTGQEASELLLQTIDTGVALINYRKLAANGTAVAPTMIGGYIITYLDKDDHGSDDYLRYLGPELKRTYQWRVDRAMKDDATAVAFRHRQFEATAALLPVLQKAGVTILAGTDAGYLNSFTYPGLGLHQELSLLVKYGLAPQQALIASVVNGPAFFGLQKDYGDISINKIADLLLLDENPLQQIDATRSIFAVVRNGHYMSRSRLDGMLKEIADWVKKKEEDEKKTKQ